MHLSSRTHRAAFLILAVIGLIDASYLYIVKLVNSPAACLVGIGDCFSVNSSRYSEIYGIPIAVFGALTYLVLITILIFEKRFEFFTTNGHLLTFGITLAGLLYSAYLTYLEIAVIHAICPYCVLSAVILLLLFILSVVRLSEKQEEPIL